MEERRHGHGHLGDWIALVLRGLGILIVLGVLWMEAFALLEAVVDGG